MKTLKIIGVIVTVAIVIDYWQWFAAAAVFAGLCYAWDARRKARLARHAACLADIDRMERDLFDGDVMIPLDVWLARREARQVARDAEKQRWNAAMEVLSIAGRISAK